MSNLKNPWLITSLILFGLLIFTVFFDFRVSPSSSLNNIIGRKTAPDASTPDTDGVSDIKTLEEQVVPKAGFTLPVRWGDLGPKVIKAGAIDFEKFKNVFESSDAPLSDKQRQILKEGSDDYITIGHDNSRFVVNFFWALGLAQKSKILDEGSMRSGQTETANFASTGGWDIGSKGTMDFYSKHQIVSLTSAQEDLVKRVTENVYRPCCGNSTAFPDCNHGMAALGFAEVMASQGFSEEEIFDALLKLNSFWFPDTYVKIAAYFERDGVSWDKVKPKDILSLEYSSASGAQEIARKVSDIPAFKSQGGSCGA